ncbi:hypothetical protein [Aeromonas sp. Y318-1]|uniref:hypothetical protein n=1 Tax=Aeromonas TaxID=642 RepID=UPI0022DF8874|nr:hypothetical protein [Aeromonas sp. Y318-1]
MRTSQYKGALKLFKRYWVAYGGLKAVTLSPYFHLSLLITIISYGSWINPNWVDTPISVLPNVIGFSLGGYAIWLALGDEKFRYTISGKSKDGSDSPFIKVNATFVHFIILQVISLLFALIVKSKPLYNSPLDWQHYALNIAPWLYDFSNIAHIVASFVGYLLFIYAILSALAATMAIFRIAGWLEVYHMKQNQQEERRK